MGDASDMSDIDRFIRSKAGIDMLAKLQSRLCNLTIRDVYFGNGTDRLVVELLLSDGQRFRANDHAFDLESLRLEHEALLVEEYFRDYPERR